MERHAGEYRRRDDQRPGPFLLHLLDGECGQDQQQCSHRCTCRCYPSSRPLAQEEGASSGEEQTRGAHRQSQCVLGVPGDLLPFHRSGDRFRQIVIAVLRLHAAQIECQHIACTDSLIRQRQGVVKHATCLCGQAHAVGRGFLSQPFEPFRQCWNYLDQR